MKKVLFYLLFVTTLSVFSAVNFAQEKNRDLKSRDSQEDSTSENVKKPKGDTTAAKKTVAVLSFEDASLGNKDLPLPKYLVDTLNKELTNTKAFNVTEKMQIAAILKERNLSFDEAMDPRTAAAVGKQVSANTAIFGTISEYTIVSDEISVLLAARIRHTATVSLIIRLVDINTGLILESVESRETAKKDSIATIGGGTNSAMTNDLKIKLFSEAANKAVKSAVKQLSPVIKNSEASVAAAQTKVVETKETPASKTKSPAVEKERDIVKPTKAENPKVARVIKEVVYLSGMGDVKIGDILSVVRGAGNGKEIAVIEITEVNERTVKAKIIQGTGILAEDRVKLIQ